MSTPTSGELALLTGVDVGYSADELYEQAPCGYLTLSTSGVVVAVNGTVLGWTGSERRAVLGRPFVHLLTPAARLSWETRVAPELGLNGRVDAAELVLHGGRGPDVPVLVSCCRTALAGDGPEVLRLVAFPAGPRFAYEHALVRARRAAEKAEARIRVLHHLASGIAAARKPEEVVQSLVQVLSQDCAASAATVWLVDEEERELRRAAGTRPPTALAPEVVRTTTTAGLVAAAARTGQVVVVESPEDCARSHPEVAAALSDARMQAALAVPLVQDGVLLGAYCLSFARPRPVGEEDVELHRMIARNTAQVLQVALLHAKLEHLALHDPLTGLANRSLLFDRLEQALIRATRRGESLAVLLLDLDGFKLVNDSLGHAAGDEVLLEVARRLTATVRDADTVARMGGDEFVVLCEGTGEQAAVLLSCELEQAVRAPIAVADDEVRVTTSVGLVVHDPGAEAAVRAGIDLVRSADAAMYRAKEGGKDRHTVYDAGMQTEAELRNRTADVVREALLDQRLVVHYQPIVDLVTGRATGVEALCRVLAADGSLLMPAEFIGVAEDRGLIVPLGQQVLDVSCRQVVAWQSEGLAHLDMSVNVAAQQAAEEDFADVVAEVLARTGCPPDRLVLELTESTLLTAAPRTLSSLHRLRELGIGIAIDDFGTRYASLHYVQHFPITELKIDRSFVAGLPHQRTERAIVGAVASLARELDLVCVAEGIETTDQQAHLAGLGVRGQGYALGRPTPAEQCAELLRRTLPPAGRAGG